MDIAIAWLQGEIGTSLSGILFILAAVTFVFGLGYIGYKLTTETGFSGRDAVGGAAIVLLIVSVLYAGSAFVPTLLG